VSPVSVRETCLKFGYVSRGEVGNQTGVKLCPRKVEQNRDAKGFLEHVITVRAVGLLDSELEETVDDWVYPVTCRDGIGPDRTCCASTLGDEVCGDDGDIVEDVGNDGRLRKSVPPCSGHVCGDWKVGRVDWE
jgi:hypothetical protein